MKKMSRKVLSRLAAGMLALTVMLNAWVPAWADDGQIADETVIAEETTEEVVKEVEEVAEATETVSDTQEEVEEAEELVEAEEVEVSETEETVAEATEEEPVQVEETEAEAEEASEEEATIEVEAEEAEEAIEEESTEMMEEEVLLMAAEAEEEEELPEATIETGDFTVFGEEENFSFENGILTITGGTVQVSTEELTAERIVIAGDATVKLNDVNIKTTKGSPITILPGVNAVLELMDGTENTADASSAGGYAGVEVGLNGVARGDGSYAATELATLTIKGSGTLRANGGSNSAGIGGSKASGDVKAATGNIIIESGTIYANAGTDGAGIGTANNINGSYKGLFSWGTITINGGTVYATGAGSGSGIGGGNHVDSGNVIINGGTIVAQGASGIGSGLGSSKNKGTPGDKGPGYYYATITINGGTITARATGEDNWGGAGIGGGGYCDATVTITGGTIYAYGGNCGSGHNGYHHGGAGIGGGYEGQGDVTITGGTVYAYAGYSAAAGIGSGGSPNSNTARGETGRSTVVGVTHLNETSVTITGGSVHAYAYPEYNYNENVNPGSRGGAGIGGGAGTDKVTITITGGTVVAYGSPASESAPYGGSGIGSGVYAAGLLNSKGKAESSSYQSLTDLSITISGGQILAVGGWGASGIGSGALNKQADYIQIDATKAQVEAYADGTKFAIDTRVVTAEGTTESLEAGRVITGYLLQGTFVHAGVIGDSEQNPEGLQSILITNENTGETEELVLMPSGYRSFAANVSAAGDYTVYTDEESIGNGEGRYFSVCSTENFQEENVIDNQVLFIVVADKVSDNFYLFPVKSIVVEKEIVAEDEVLPELNTTLYFALQAKDNKEFVTNADGSVSLEKIEVVNGIPQNKVWFVNVQDKSYDVWEMTEDGEAMSTGATVGEAVLDKIATRHGDDSSNNATLSPTQWTDKVVVINTYVMEEIPVETGLTLVLAKELPAYYNAGTATNATFIFRVQIANAEGVTYDQYYAFTFGQAGKQEETIELPTDADSATVRIEEVYGAGYTAQGSAVQVIDLTDETLDRSTPYRVSYVNEYTGNPVYSSGINNQYKNRSYVSSVE